MVNAGFSSVPHWGKGKLTLKVDVFNVLDVGKVIVIDCNQQKDKSQGFADISKTS